MNASRPLYVAVTGRKGGVGKTTAALSLAAYALRRGLRVLLVDLDPQGSASLSLNVSDNAGEHLRAVLEGEQAPEPAESAEGLQVLAGGPAMESYEPTAPLRETLATVAGDLVIVDSPPCLAALDRLAINSAHVVLACCEPHRLAIAGAARVLDEAGKLRPAPRCAVVLGRLDPRRSLDATTPEILAGAFRAPVMSVRQDSALASALNSGQLPPATGRAAEDFARIAKWIL